MVELRAKELERASRSDPSVLDGEELLALMACEDWTVRMHVCRMLSRVSWSPADYKAVREFALTQVQDKNTFVRAWALNALVAFAVNDDTIRRRVLSMIEDALANGPPSIKAQARLGLQRL